MLKQTPFKKQLKVKQEGPFDFTSFFDYSKEKSFKINYLHVYRFFRWIFSELLHQQPSESFSSASLTLLNLLNKAFR